METSLCFTGQLFLRKKKQYWYWYNNCHDIFVDQIENWVHWTIAVYWKRWSSIYSHFILYRKRRELFVLNVVDFKIETPSFTFLMIHIVDIKPDFHYSISLEILFIDLWLISCYVKMGVIAFILCKLLIHIMHSNF